MPGIDYRDLGEAPEHNQAHLYRTVQLLVGAGTRTQVQDSVARPQPRPVDGQPVAGAEVVRVVVEVDLDELGVFVHKERQVRAVRVVPHLQELDIGVHGPLDITELLPPDRRRQWAGDVDAHESYTLR